MQARIATALIKDSPFSLAMLDWMLKQTNQEYLDDIIPDRQQKYLIHIPCELFVTHFGKQKNYRTKLHDIMEALPAEASDITLHGLNAEGQRIQAFDIRRTLEAMQGNPDIKTVRFSDDKLFLLREFCREKKHKAVDLFSMIMRGIGSKVTCLYLDGCDPFPDFINNQHVRAKFAEIDKRHLSAGRKQGLKDEFMAAFRKDIVAEYKKKLSQIPDSVEELHLENNYFNKFTEVELIEILSGLSQKQKLRDIYLYDNSLELSDTCLDEIKTVLPENVDLRMESLDSTQSLSSSGSMRFGLFARTSATATPSLPHHNDHLEKSERRLSTSYSH